MAYLTYHLHNQMVNTDSTDRHPLAAYVDDDGNVRDVRTDYVCEAAVSYTDLAGQTHYLRIPETQCPEPRMHHQFDNRIYDPAEIVRAEGRWRRLILYCAKCPRCNIKIHNA